MLCPVCSTQLRNQVTSCSRCPMNSGCDMLCCENCGYETVAPRSVTVEFFRRLLRRGRGHEHGHDRSPEPTRG